MTVTVPVAGVCSACGVAVLNRTPYSYVEVVGWRRLDGSGRPAGLAEYTTTGRVLCRSCPPGETPGQVTLLDA